LDAQVVRPDDMELTRLLQEFVPVRLTSFKGVDMNRFRFDYDLTFAALMMNADGVTYARFGTKDAQSATDRLSIPGLKRAMRQVLAVHRRGGTAGSANTPGQARLTLADIPAYARSRAAKQGCAHCHFANNFRFAQLRAEGKFTKEMLFQYPLPENIGLTLDVDANNVVKAVLPHSPAQRAGAQPGDVLLRANETPVYTSADLQFALNTVPDAGEVTLLLQRKGRTLPAMTLSLPRGWRRTDISWRPSQEVAPPMIGIWMQPFRVLNVPVSVSASREAAVSLVRDVFSRIPQCRRASCGRIRLESLSWRIQPSAIHREKLALRFRP
jgi:hypothetical protein